MRVVVVGAGAMGLAAAWRAAQDGHSVTVLEAAAEAGGMAGHFDFDGLSLERFYHFICRTDAPLFALLAELGIADRLRWRTTTMGLFHRGELHAWGDPLALLRFPHLSPLGKVRYGFFAWACVWRDRWPALEQQTAQAWISRWCGAEVYAQLWRPLLELKYYEHADAISAAWIWRRIRRIGRSRANLFQEELGYLEGGTKTLVDALIAAVERLGGRVQLGAAAVRVTASCGRVTAVEAADGSMYAADAVISTVPTPLVGELVPDLPESWKQRYAAIENIGVICVVLRLARSVTPHFWVNISEPGIEIPGVIEFSNLRDLGGETVVYVPYYLPATHAKFAWPDERLIEEACACLTRLNPAVTKAEVLGSRVGRLRYGQAVCGPGFAARVPTVQTPIAGLQLADTCFYYPEDRGIAESVRLGAAMASAL